MIGIKDPVTGQMKVITNTNSGGYVPPTGGIPRSDLSQNVQDSLDLADTALQSFTETDPVYTQDKPNLALKSELETLSTTLEGVDTALDTRLTQAETDIQDIDDLIPNQATTTNQLADKDFVNSSVSNMAANYVTPDPAGQEQWSSLDALRAGTWYNGGSPYSPSQNDYAIFINTDGSIWRASFNGNLWSPTFKINDTPFTQTQLQAINSGITTELVQKILSNESNISSLQTSISNLETYKQTNIPASINGYLATHSGTAGAFGTPVNPKTLIETTEIVTVGYNSLSGLIQGLGISVNTTKKFFVYEYNMSSWSDVSSQMNRTGCFIEATRFNTNAVNVRLTTFSTDNKPTQIWQGTVNVSSAIWISPMSQVFIYNKITTDEIAWIPNYSLAETINRISALNGTWTVDRDGFVRVEFTNSTAGSGVAVHINNYSVHKLGAGTSVWNSVILAVKKGDVVKLVSDYGSPSVTDVNCRYIPPVGVVPPTMPMPPTTGTYTLKSVDGVMSWVSA